MVKGKGKGKKQTVNASHDDPGSGKEECGPTNKRRGRPTKPLKDDYVEEIAKIVEDGKDVKDSIPGKEVKSQSATENGGKRKMPEHADKNIDPLKEETSVVGTKLNPENSTMSTGFRQIGSRRKNKPRRAAEAVVECS